MVNNQKRYPYTYDRACRLAGGGLHLPNWLPPPLMAAAKSGCLSCVMLTTVPFAMTVSHATIL